MSLYVDVSSEGEGNRMMFILSGMVLAYNEGINFGGAIAKQIKGNQQRNFMLLARAVFGMASEEELKSGSDLAPHV